MPELLDEGGKYCLKHCLDFNFLLSDKLFKIYFFILPFCSFFIFRLLGLFLGEVILLELLEFLRINGVMIGLLNFLFNLE